MQHIQRKKSVKGTTFETFLRRANFILMFFSEDVASLLCVGNHFPTIKKTKK